MGLSVSLSRSILLPFLVSLGLAGLACGGSVNNDSPDGDPNEGAGGAAGAGGTTGVNEEAGVEDPSPACQDIAGTYVLSAGFQHPSIWMWIHETSDFGCSAIVSSSGFPGRRYRVEQTPSSVVIEPEEEPAQGGDDGLISFARTTFEVITLDVTQDARIEAATADVLFEWNQEDVWGSSSETIELSVREAESGKVEVPEAILPWTRGEVLGTRPTSGLSQHVSVPSDDWSVTDLTGGGEGITHAEFSYVGGWDDVRGRTLSFALLPGLVDISGAAMGTGPFELLVRDIGPALAVHEMFDASSVVTWGHGAVEPHTEGDCATLGCVVLESWGGDYVGIAGQLITEGATSAVVTMRPSGMDPLFVRVEVVAQDGTLIPAATGGSWKQYEPEQIWTYEVAGHKRVGFSIEVAASSHGWGGPLVVEGVATQ